jgi:hypothetical protein
MEQNVGAKRHEDTRSQSAHFLRFDVPHAGSEQKGCTCMTIMQKHRYPSI